MIRLCGHFKEPDPTGTINFAKLLSGRNNDHLGYWAVGQLSLLAQENNVESISFDLLKLSNSLGTPQALEMCQQMKIELYRLLEAQKIPCVWIKSISVEFSLVSIKSTKKSTITGALH